ncbi:hypothetical protein [Limnothrix redekei]|uniref:Uncharacterized protein n=1 Tax=Limnothrix redekei LRLZ20PSL1 TaxID=3112953 RepID=A0ABW7C6N8_9CYAN
MGTTLKPVSTIATDFKERLAVPVARYALPIRGVDFPECLDSCLNSYSLYLAY